MPSEYPEHCKQKEIGNSLLQQCNNAKQANLHQNLGQISERKELSTSFKALYQHYKNRDIDTNIIGDHVFYMLSILVKNQI